MRSECLRPTGVVDGIYKEVGIQVPVVSDAPDDGIDEITGSTGLLEGLFAAEVPN